MAYSEIRDCRRCVSCRIAINELRCRPYLSASATNSSRNLSRSVTSMRGSLLLAASRLAIQNPLFKSRPGKLPPALARSVYCTTSAEAASRQRPGGGAVTDYVGRLRTV